MNSNNFPTLPNSLNPGWGGGNPGCGRSTQVSTPNPSWGQGGLAKGSSPQPPTPRQEELRTMLQLALHSATYSARFDEVSAGAGSTRSQTWI